MVLSGSPYPHSRIDALRLAARQAAKDKQGLPIVRELVQNETYRVREAVKDDLKPLEMTQ